VTSVLACSPPFTFANADDATAWAEATAEATADAAAVLAAEARAVAADWAAETAEAVGEAAGLLDEQPTSAAPPSITATPAAAYRQN
jgi:hypothetical protein